MVLFTVLVLECIIYSIALCSPVTVEPEVSTSDLYKGPFGKKISVGGPHLCLQVTKCVDYFKRNELSGNKNLEYLSAVTFA